MPKTFKDALQVTRMLGYRYLWIDAICIIQDDPEDLRNEMAVMGDIYRQSAVTIFAANGPNTDSGLFSKRDARTSKACNVLITLKRDSKLLHGDISIKMGKDTSYDFLNSRGWVLQEEVLSGRLIAFGPSMVDWRCMEIHTCEGGTTLNISNSIDISHNDKEMLFEMPNDLMRSIVRRPDLFDKSLPSSDGFRHTHFDTWYEMSVLLESGLDISGVIIPINYLQLQAWRGSCKRIMILHMLPDCGRKTCKLASAGG